MDIKKLLLIFGGIFVLALVVTAITTYLYSLLVHGTGIIDWETSIRSAITLGIILTWIETKKSK
jgi:hypothetical protein